MRIFVIPGFYKTENRPRVCPFLYEQSEALSKEHEIVVLSVRPTLIWRRKKNSKKTTKMQEGNVTIRYIEMPLFYKPNHLKYLYSRQYKFYVKRLIDAAIEEFGRPDILYAHFSLYAGYSVAKLSQHYDIPVVIEEHHGRLMRKITQHDRKILQYSIENANRFLCVSDGLKESLLHQLSIQKELFVVPNMVSPCFTYHNPVEQDNFVFFSLGNLIPGKGFDLLIDAFCEEFGKKEKVELRIGGAGKEKGSLENQINSYDEDRIKLLGLLDREQTLQEYINCNSFVLPSRGETFGIVYREAMAVGRPIITTNHGGFSQKGWNNDLGQMIEIDDKNALRKALRYMVGNYHNYDGRKISRLCLGECALEAVVGKLDSIFQDVVGLQKRMNGNE